MLTSVLQAYNFDEPLSIVQLGTGLINHTWKIKKGNDAFILQRINEDVFKQPGDIAQNLSTIGQYLKQHQPAYLFVQPVVAKNGDTIVSNDNGIFRMFPFVKGSHSKDVVQTVDQAYEAAVQFGRFTSLLAGIDIGQIKITLPLFHDLTYRYQQFLDCLQTGNQARIANSKNLIETVILHAEIVDTFEQIKVNPAFKIRVMHHDTKISNVLFNDNDKGLCVIDLDTVMPGYFFSDVGDMMRTYLCAVSEEESDLSKIIVREDFYKAIVDGYRSEMKGELTETENNHFFYAAKFMVYMQVLRFLTDHINNDQYYGAKYEGHNLVRTTNQLVLLQRLLEKEAQLKLIAIKN